jgi:hypothetical protein
MHGPFSAPEKLKHLELVTNRCWIAGSDSQRIPWKAGQNWRNQSGGLHIAYEKMSKEQTMETENERHSGKSSIAEMRMICLIFTSSI